MWIRFSPSSWNSDSKTQTITLNSHSNICGLLSGKEKLFSYHSNSYFLLSAYALLHILFCLSSNNPIKKVSVPFTDKGTEVQRNKATSWMKPEQLVSGGTEIWIQVWVTRKLLLWKWNFSNQIIMLQTWNIKFNQHLTIYSKYDCSYFPSLKIGHYSHSFFSRSYSSYIAYNLYRKLSWL